VTGVTNVLGSFGYIYVGNSGRLLLEDAGQSFSAALAGLGNNADKSGTNTGFSLRVFTPKAWLMQVASEAAKEYRPFGLSDITDEMLQPVLRVTVYPDKPTYVTASGLKGTSSVQHVILRDLSKKIVVQPASKEEFDDSASNAAGGKASFIGLRATFPMDSVREIRGPRNAGFYIVVIGTEGTKERRFEVKAKHFGDLP
jgi:hypothetical protein